MADETEFAMGAEAHCSDGLGGRVSRVIVDPATDTVTHLVENGIWLNLTREQVENLPPAADG